MDYTLEDLLLETDTFPSRSRLRKAVEQKSLKVGGRPVSLVGLHSEPCDMAEGMTNSLVVKTSKTTGLIVHAMMNDKVWFTHAR